ncbi:MAG: MFS transporter [bacterium]
MNGKKKTEKSWRGYLILKEVNPVIRILTISDIMVIGGYGLIAPIFAIFITDTIPGGSVEVAGIASAIYIIAQSVFQIPLAAVVDRIKGERDDFWALFVGSVAFSIVPLFYLMISTPMQLYIVQFLYGLATAATLPSWYAIFCRHLDKDHTGLEWGVYRTLTDSAGAGAAFIGGLMAYRYGFDPLFLMVSLTSFIGTMFLLGVYKKMRKGKILKKHHKKSK